MKRLLAVSLVLCLSLVSTDCGSVFVGGFFNPHPNSSITGIVSFVEVNTIISNGITTKVTFVTFFSNSVSSSVRFCGDQTSQFPLNQMVTTKFNQGQSCATLIVVIIVG